MQLRPESKDAFEGPQVTEQASEIYAIVGENERAIELLDRLMSRPSEMTVSGPQAQSGVGSFAKIHGFRR